MSAAIHAGAWCTICLSDSACPQACEQRPTCVGLYLSTFDRGVTLWGNRGPAAEDEKLNAS